MCEDETNRKFEILTKHRKLSHTQFAEAKPTGYDSVPEFLDDHRALEPPDPIPNSAVKRCIADGSVGFPHVRVGHRQAPIPKPPSALAGGGLAFMGYRKFIGMRG